MKTIRETTNLIIFGAYLNLYMWPGIQISDTLLIDSLKTDSLAIADLGTIHGNTPKLLTSFQGSETLMLAQPAHSWYFFFLIVLMIAYAISRIFLGQILSSTFIATIRYSSTLSMYKDNSQVQNQRDSVLYAYYFLSLSFFLLLLENRMEVYPYGLSEGLLYLFNFSVLLVYFILRRSLLHFVGFLFERQDLFNEYQYHNFAYNKLLGIIFIPLNFVLVYTHGILNDIFFYLAISVILFMIIMKISRGVIFSFRHRIFSFYLFLYLCALEMVPATLLYKWVIAIL